MLGSSAKQSTDEQSVTPLAPQPRRRRKGERVPAHALVPEPAAPSVCRPCGLAASDRAHTRRPAQPETNGDKRDKGRFAKGGPPGPGRPTGSRNQVTRQIREMCQRIVTDPIYVENLMLRARAGVLASAMEVMLYHYAIGKPREILEHQERPAFRIVFMGPRRDPLADESDYALDAEPPMPPPVPGDDGAEGGATEVPL